MSTVGREFSPDPICFDRPVRPMARHLRSVPLLARHLQYIVVDAGSHITRARWAPTPPTPVYGLHPDVPIGGKCPAPAQRCAAGALRRARARAAQSRRDPYPIPPKQIEAALGHPIHHTFPSDYKTVSTALNSGVPLALTGNSDIAGQFDHFTRQILDPEAGVAAPPQPARRKLPGGLERIASIW